MEKQTESTHVGIILSGATSSEAACQLLEEAEKGSIREGMLLLVESGTRKILSRVAQIVPFNAFYTEGDTFSEPRRKGLPIPEEVARKYEICKLDLLIEIPQGEIKYPPRPGDRVRGIDPKLHEKEIFGVGRSDLKHVWYASLPGVKDGPVPLNVENIPMHLAIFGVTGSGKSFDTGALIERLADIPVHKKGNASYPMIIVDAHGDYTDYANYVESGKKLGRVSWIKRYVFPNAYVQPKQRKATNIQPVGLRLDLIAQRDLAEIIILFYKGTVEGAELQVDSIDTLFDSMKGKGYTVQDLFLRNFEDLLEELNRYAKAVDMHSQTKGAVIRALRNFRIIENKHKLLSTKSDLQEGPTAEQVKFVDEITKDGGIAIFDFSADGAPGVDLRTKQFVMTYLASLLFEQFTNYKVKKEDRYLLFIVEEAQNFVPDRSYPVGSSLAHRTLSAIATQGRKFGLSLCLISQRPSFVDRIVLSMCNTFLIHRVSPDDVGFVRSVSGGLQSSLANRLTTLDTGELILTGQMTTVPFPLLVSVPETDRMIKPTIGRTNVSESIAKLRGLT